MRLEARATRRPGDKGTKRLLERYGARLLFVRYRYNPETQSMLTTVELIVDERPARPRNEPQPPVSTPIAEQVGLRIAARERWLQDKVRAAGGYWDPRRALWILPAPEAARLRLSSWVVSPPPAVATGSNQNTLEATL
jgi:hypothetical protein